MTVEFKPQSLEINAKPGELGTSTGNPIVKEYVERPAYDGPYEITPSAEAQVIRTKHLRMTDDLTISPIPQNYGLITRYGEILIIS